MNKEINQSESGREYLQKYLPPLRPDNYLLDVRVLKAPKLQTLGSFLLPSLVPVWIMGGVVLLGCPKTLMA